MGCGKWYVLWVALFMVLTIFSYGQWNGKSQYTIRGNICIDSPDTLGALIKVIANITVVNIFPAGKKTYINTTVAELPVRLKIVVIPYGKASFTVANFWVETSDPFEINGTYADIDSVIFFPPNELNAFELEFMKTSREIDKLRLIAANSNHEAGLYHLWYNRFNYKSTELDYFLRRANQASREFSAFRLLNAFNEAKTTNKQFARGPWKNFNATGRNRQSYSVPAPDKKYTLVYFQIPGAQDMDGTTDILDKAHLLYQDQLQVYTISFPTLDVPLLLQLHSAPFSLLATTQPWPQLYDYTGESLLHFRVKLKMPLANGFNSGLDNRNTFISPWEGAFNLQDNINRNKHKFLLLSNDGKLLGRWSGSYQKNILTDLQKIMKNNVKTRTLTLPD